MEPQVERLPPRTGRRFANSTPYSSQPKCTRGWSWEMLNTAIQQCNMRGAWKQGGQEARAVFEGAEYERRFLINYQRGTVWVQGRDAVSVDVQLRAARGA